MADKIDGLTNNDIINAKKAAEVSRILGSLTDNKHKYGGIEIKVEDGCIVNIHDWRNRK